MIKNLICLAVSVLIVFVGCRQNSSDANKVPSQGDINSIIQHVQSLPNTPVSENEKGIIQTSLGTIEIKFFPDVAPNHCANFKKLANSGFYDGTTFHRVIPGFVIQGGDILSRDSNPANDGTGDAGYKLDAEFSDLHHERGILSTARAPMDINSAGTQFFICVSNAYNLDGQYTIFGKVSKGMDIVDKIVNVPRDSRDRPYKNVVMEKVRVK